MRLSKQNWLKKRMDIALTAFFLSFSGFAHADSAPDIQRLIDRVGALKDARFIRNDRSYSAAYAKEFLQRKWQAQCKDAASVQAFIDACASKSGTTGKPYLIQQNNLSRPAAEVLRELAAAKP